LPNMRRKTAFATRVAVACRGARVRHSLAKAIHRLFDENGFFWVNTPIITASDAEGAGALFRASTLDLANLPRTLRAGSFRAGFLWPRGVSDGVGAAQCRGLMPGAYQSLHLRADLSRRELEHQPPPRRVLDDRAGDRLRRPLGQCGVRGRAAEVHLTAPMNDSLGKQLR